MKCKSVDNKSSEGYPSFEQGRRLLSAGLMIGAGLSLAVTMGACNKKDAKKEEAPKKGDVPAKKVQVDMKKAADMPPPPKPPMETMKPEKVRLGGVARVANPPTGKIEPKKDDMKAVPTADMKKVKPKKPVKPIRPRLRGRPARVDPLKKK